MSKTPKTTEERITAIEAQRADLAAQLKQARTKAEQAASTGGNILAAQTTVRDLEGAISALDEAQEQAQAELAQEQAQSHRAQVVEHLRDLAQQRQAAAQQMREHAQHIHDVFEVHLVGLRDARAAYRQSYYDAAIALREAGGHFRHFMQMDEEKEATDQALIDELRAQGIDIDLLLALPDEYTNWHHHATGRDALGHLLPEEAPYRAEIARLAFGSNGTPQLPQPVSYIRRSPLDGSSGQPGAAPDDGRAAFIREVKAKLAQQEQA